MYELYAEGLHFSAFQQVALIDLPVILLAWRAQKEH